MKIPKTPLPKRGNLAKYQSDNPLQQYLIRCFLAVIRSVVRDAPSGRLCEIGCGEGFVLRNLGDHGLLKQRRVIGLELDEEALRFARGHVPKTSFLRASAYDLPLRDKSIGCLMLLEVLEHLQNPVRALEEAARVSRSLLISVPHEPFFQAANLLRGKNLKHFGNDPEHCQHWGQSSFLELLRPFGKITRHAAPFPWLVAYMET